MGDLDLLSQHGTEKLAIQEQAVAIQTDAGSGWNRGLADPERHPREDHQQGGGNVGLQDEEQDVPTESKVQY